MGQQNKFLNTAPLVSSSKTVEGRLWETMKRLAETEGNLHLFSKLKTLGVGTNDVENFVKKQSGHKRVHASIDAKVRRVAMHSKLADACAYTKRLRRPMVVEIGLCCWCSCEECHLSHGQDVGPASADSHQM